VEGLIINHNLLAINTQNNLNKSNKTVHLLSNTANAGVNLNESNPRIVDVDMAQEYATLTKEQMLTLISQFMLAQANTIPQNVLKLLQ
jgi:flagellin